MSNSVSRISRAGGDVFGGFIPFRSHDRELAAFRTLQRTIGFAVVLGLLLALASAYVLARQIAGPIRRLALATRQVQDGDYSIAIEARSGEHGKPTPEGMHRDGVDYVLVLLVNRRNIKSGTTTVHDLDKRTLGSFTLTDPLDAALVDDARCYHGVTPVEPENPAQPAYRDVLVVTFRKTA